MQLPDARWALRRMPADATPDLVEALARKLGVPGVVAGLLWQRGFADEARARSFLAPRLQDLAPPLRLPDIDKAAERLAKAVRAGERIAICGDYDVDGMTGTALLVRFFRMAGAEVVWWIPQREEEGYGLSVRGVEKLGVISARSRRWRRRAGGRKGLGTRWVWPGTRSRTRPST